jgi:NAD(P)-dependent dehydrogenase (short-subunit alcohol dehydrogenase family)
MTHGTRGIGRGAAIAALIAGCLLIGVRIGATGEAPSLATLRADVQEEVKDPDRALRALAALDSLQALVPVYAAHQARASAELRALLRDYDATRAAFEEAAARWESDRAELRSRALAAHEAFKKALTGAEWGRLRGTVHRLLFQYPVVHVEALPEAKEEGR